MEYDCIIHNWNDNFSNIVCSTKIHKQVMKMGATYEQQYKHILQEFVDYCNKQTPTQRMTGLNRLLNQFIDKKMERYR